ncbi:MAG: NAD(P)H-quinone oxidoreductase [Acidobacteriota bacterium]
MRAALFDRPGDETVLRLGEAPVPVPGPGEVRISVAATALNRADLLQRQGKYPPPPGASAILGLECAGVVSALGEGVRTLGVGDRVMALLAGGGYAEETVAPAGCCLPVPGNLSLVEAAAVPEAFLTVHLTVFRLAGLRPGETLLVHGGGSGIGTAAIQMARAAGARVLVTAGSVEKCRRCEALGAERAIDYRAGDFAPVARDVTGGRGVDVVLDSIGAPYLGPNLEALAPGGRLVVIATMGGHRGELDLARLMRLRASVIGSTLRSRSVEEKAALVEEFSRRFLPMFCDGRLRPVIDRVLPLEAVARAHRTMAASEHFGKIVLAVAG